MKNNMQPEGRGKKKASGNESEYKKVMSDKWTIWIVEYKVYKE